MLYSGELRGVVWDAEFLEVRLQFAVCWEGPIAHKGLDSCSTDGVAPHAVWQAVWKHHEARRQQLTAGGVVERLRQLCYADEAAAAAVSPIDDGTAALGLIAVARRQVDVVADLGASGATCVDVLHKAGAAGWLRNPRTRTPRVTK